MSEVECEQYNVDAYENVEGWMESYVHNNPHTILDYINYYQKLKVWI